MYYCKVFFHFFHWDLRYVSKIGWFALLFICLFFHLCLCQCVVINQVCGCRKAIFLSPSVSSSLLYPRDWLISTQFIMPAIVNLLFNTVSTNTTISFSLVLPLVSILSLLVGVGGHLLMWLVLMRNPRRRSKPSSVLLLNLSFADLCALLTLPCVLLSASSQNWQLGGGVCVLLSFMTSLTAGVDIFSLAALSVLRYRIVAPSTRPPATPAQVWVSEGDWERQLEKRINLLYILCNSL